MKLSFKNSGHMELSEQLLASMGATRNLSVRGYIIALVASSINLAERAGVKSLDFNSARDLENFHRTIIKRRTAGSLLTEREKVGKFVGIPFAGTENIQPITSDEDYLIECIEMYTCESPQPGQDVMQTEMLCGSDIVAYRVFDPVRATLILANDYPGWSVLALCGKGGARVSDAHEKEIYRNLLRSPRLLDLNRGERAQSDNGAETNLFMTLAKYNIESSAKLAVNEEKNFSLDMELHDEMFN